MSWQPFKRGQWCYPFSACSSAGCDCPVVTQVNQENHLEQTLEVLSLSRSLSLSSTCVSQRALRGAGLRHRLLNLWFVQIFPGVQSPVKCRHWQLLRGHRVLLCVGSLLLWCGFPPWCLACLGPSRASRAFSGFASAQPWWLLPC